MRPFIAEIIESLVVRHGIATRVDLNDIAEVIGGRAVSYDEVDLIITTLQQRGCQVGGEPSVREMALLGEVLQAARRLREQLERQPSVDEIAAAIEQPTFVVRRAVESGGALGRSKPS